MFLAHFRLIGLLSILFFFLNVPQNIFPQTELPFDEDPLINPEAVSSENTQTFQDNEGFMVGIVYGLHPALLFSPALSLAYYKNPLNFGIEISDSDRFEFQVLYGVPMHGWNQKHLDSGYKVRVYVPFGKDWYKYSIRRLKENPDIAGYIIKNLFSK